MERIGEKFSDLRNTMILSIVLHLLFLLAAMFIQIGFEFDTSEFTEISFVSGSPTPKQVTLTKRGETEPTTAQPETPAESEPAYTPPSQTQKNQTVTRQPVNVPKTRTLATEEPELAAMDPGKITPDMDRKIRPSTPEPIRGDRPSQLKSSMSTDGVHDRGTSYGQVTESDMEGAYKQTGTRQPFTIEGDAARRTILNQVIPKYPSGLQKEAVVKMRFTLYPDGRIGGMIPLIKGDPVLDRITIEALQKWRFNMLPPDSEQKNVQGIITFRYELK